MLKRLQCLAQAFVLDRQRVAEFHSREHHAWDKKIEDPVLETAAVPFVRLGDDLQMDCLRVGRDKL